MGDVFGVQYGSPGSLLESRWLLAGLGAGIAFLGKPIHVVFIIVCGLLALSQQGWRAAARFGLGALPSLLIVLAYNQVLFGDPFTFSYDRMLAEDGSIYTQRSDFSLALIPSALTGQFLDIRHGLLFTAPTVLLACIGLLHLWRRDRRLALVPAAIAIAYLGVFSTYRPWHTSHIGNRFLFVVVVLSALPLGVLIERRERKAS